MDEPIRFYDPPEKIKQCLSCRRIKCTNCMAKKGLTLKSDKIDPDKFMEMYNRGMNDAEIGIYYGLDRTTIRNYRLRMNLPSTHNLRRKRHAGS